MTRHANRKTRAQACAPAIYNKCPWKSRHGKPKGTKKRVQWL